MVDWWSVNESWSYCLLDDSMAWRLDQLKNAVDNSLVCSIYLVSII
ncbi:hypothetical protein LINPERHAP1_LOCUS15341 [Linum perenne]